MDRLAAFLTGRRDPEVIEGLAAELGDWLGGEKMATRIQVRRAMRDRYLRHAGDAIPAASSWDRAGILAERVRLFELDRWPKWEPMSQPPRQADEVDRLLFLAWKLDVHPIPRSQGGLFRKL